MSIVKNFEQFVAFLIEQKIPHRIDAERQIIELPSNGAPLPGNLVIKWEKHIPFFQIIHFMIENVPVDRVREIETALVRLDNRLEVGSFGFDHASGRLYNRLTVPVFAIEGVNANAIGQLSNGVMRSAQDFLEVFQEIIGGKAGEHVLEIYEAIAAKRKAAESPSKDASATT